MVPAPHLTSVYQLWPLAAGVVQHCEGNIVSSCAVVVRLELTRLELTPSAMPGLAVA